MLADRLSVVRCLANVLYMLRSIKKIGYKNYSSVKYLIQKRIRRRVL